MTWSTAEVAAVAARDIPPGTFVNLGIGMPLAIADQLDPADEILVHSENGIIGVAGVAPAGHEDPDLVNAGKQYVTLVPGAAITDHVDSFALLRAGHVEMAFLGAHQVSFAGDLANWRRPSERIAGVGGALDIAHGVADIRVVMKLLDADGRPKLLPECTFPLTARGVVRRIYTDLGVMHLTEGGIRVVALPDGHTTAELAALLGTDVVDATAPGEFTAD